MSEVTTLNLIEAFLGLAVIAIFITRWIVAKGDDNDKDDDDE